MFPALPLWPLRQRLPDRQSSSQAGRGLYARRTQKRNHGGRTPASFEPTIDYVVVKTPRFAFEKFPKADKRLTTQMKSVGEVMAIGRTFQEALQKALRGLETGKDGLNEISTDRATIHHEISEPGPDRLWYLADAFRLGYTVKEAHRATRIDPWFLVQVKELVDIENRLKEYSLRAL